MKSHLKRGSHTEQPTTNSRPTTTVEDRRPEALAQRQLQQNANNSPQVQEAAQLQAMADAYTSRQAADKPYIQMNVNRPPVQKAAEAPAQLVGDVRFNNISKDAIEAKSKAQNVAAQLERSDQVKRYLADKDCIISLSKPGLNDLTPAEVTEVSGQVQVTLAPWFFDTSSVGEIIGMLAHEFAVHPMGDWALSANDKEKEDDQAKDGKEMDSQYYKRTLNPLTSDTHKLKDDGKNQKDHLFMVKKNEARAEYYRKVTYELVEGLLIQSKEKNSKVGKADVQAAIISYLGDVATTVVSNDHRNDMAFGDKARLPDAIKEARSYWEVECKAHGDDNSKEIWQLSQGWVDGANQAMAFQEKQANRGDHETDSIDDENLELQKDGASANQLRTIQALKWPTDKWTPLNTSANVHMFYNHCAKDKTPQEVQSAFTDIITETQTLSNMFTAISVKDGAWPKTLDRKSIQLLGQKMGVEICIVQTSGALKKVSSGGRKIVLAEKPNGDFELVTVV